MYEEYMQNLLGIRLNPYRDTYMQPDESALYAGGYEQPSPYGFPRANMYSVNENIEEMYPEIYKIVYPMVQKACMQNSRPITRDLIDSLTNEIYNNIETDNVINVNVNVDNSKEARGERQIETKERKSVENVQLNKSLDDLIRILLIREFLGRNGKVPQIFRNFA